jgi:hypothetical protein
MTRNVYIGPSKIAGKGVFASKDFSKGDIVFILKGEVRKWVVKDKETSSEGPNWVGIRHGVWIDPAEPAVFLNHSCNPNIGIKGSVTFVALRNIKKGEEVAFDYSTTEDDLLWRLPFKCACGAKNCRSSIRSIQFMPKQVFKAYLPYVPKYFQKVYTDYNKILKAHGNKV